MKKVMSLALASAMLLAMFSGCGGNTTEPTVDTEGSSTTEEVVETSKIFNNYLLADVDTVNPHIYTMSDSGTIFDLVSLHLYRYAPNEAGDAFIFTTELAESDPQQTDEEGKVWTIKILENAKWQNGDAITIDDVIYSWKMCLDPLLVNSRASQMASDYITIVNAKEYSLQGSDATVAWEDVGIKKIDDYTVEITCTDAVTATDVKSHINYTWNGLVHEGTYEANMSADRTSTTYGSTGEKFMSCGRFILDAWIQGAQFTLTKNPDYVLADETQIDGMVYKIVGDSNTALELFLSGSLDVVNVGADAIEQYIEDPRLMKAPSSSISSLAVNMGNTDNNGILGDADFRRALYYAVDRESIAKVVNGIPANWAVPTKCIGDLSTGTAFRDMPESQEYLPENYGYDTELAKEYYDTAMAAAGLDSLTLTLMYSESSSNYKAASEYLQKTLTEIFGDSFKLELMAVTSSVATEYIHGWRDDGNVNSFELSWRGWNTSTPAPWNGLKVYSSMYTNKNEPYFNEVYDDLWTKANLTLEAKLDNDYRLDLVRQMEQIVIEDAVTIPVYEGPGHYLIADRVTLPVQFYIPGYGFGYSLSSIA